MYVKREVLDAIGDLDEAYGMSYEDTDFCLRAWQAGFRCLYVPGSRLVHLEGVTRGTEMGPRERAAQEHFWDTWRSFFHERPVTAPDGGLRIVYALNYLGPSGGIRVIIEHLNRLAERGHHPELLSLGDDPGWLELRVPHRSFADYDEMADHLDAQEAIKVATWWETGRPVWIGSVRRGIPVFYVQDIEDSYYRGDVRGGEEVLAGYKPEFDYLTTSRYNQDKLAELGRPSTPIPVGIDGTVFRVRGDVERERDVLIALGRKHYLKNFEMTFLAWQQMHPRPRLWLFGNEPDAAPAHPLITYHELPDDEQINELLNRATVFVQTSVHEGFCLPAIEAMAAGAPVVTTDSHGNRDYIEPGRNCLLVPQGDHRELARTLEGLFADRALQDELRAGGLETAAHYEWGPIMDEVEGYYRGLAERARQPGSELSVL
jgi:glycosyltransferase involved in cell wall biosynthesis